MLASILALGLLVAGAAVSDEAADRAIPPAQRDSREAPTAAAHNTLAETPPSTWLWVAQVIKEGILACVALATAYFAWRGVDAWRKQLKANVEHEAARRLLHQALAARDTLCGARFPVVTSEEADAVLGKEAYDKLCYDEPRLRETPFACHRQRQVYRARAGRVATAFSELHIAALEAAVLWGERAVAEALCALNDCRTLWQRSLNHYLLHQEALARHEPSLFSSNQILEDLEVVSDMAGASEEDDFTRRIRAAVDRLDAYVAQHLLTRSK
jgi:hypothetical protein